ncbi:hypothetical protein G9444_2503 [Rhodococcus erythropolis]|uniref:Uncharacterized protein n=1 Tax=Rhodococcus erythropolis TaxID=1833 RepID=A0A6G9CRX0_RHOER|nr:hypothetical protein [Rhodococcus erythropolis]QIP39747.1 hypothetical protein G9444_2503 [Rhodococcus erythropolis]
MIKDRSTAGVVVTAPDPGLTDLIAAHQAGDRWTDFQYPSIFSDKPFVATAVTKMVNCSCGESMPAESHPVHVALVVEQHTNGRTAELEAENVRLRAQVASIGHVHPGACSPVETHPDDREINEAIDESECFADAMFEIAEKYGANVTNNMDRWQDGVFLRHIAEFIEDVETAALKHLRAALEGEQQ